MVVVEDGIAVDAGGITTDEVGFVGFERKIEATWWRNFGSNDRILISHGDNTMSAQAMYYLEDASTHQIVKASTRSGRIPSIESGPKRYTLQMCRIVWGWNRHNVGHSSYASPPPPSPNPKSHACVNACERGRCPCFWAVVQHAIPLALFDKDLYAAGGRDSVKGRSWMFLGCGDETEVENVIRSNGFGLRRIPHNPQIRVVSISMDSASFRLYFPERRPHLAFPHSQRRLYSEKPPRLEAMSERLE